MFEELKTRPVQGSEWMIAIRDYKFGLTVYEISVGSLYGTCGNWGQQVWLSDKAISDITGMTRRKASTARKTLLSLGLIEDTGPHGYQPNQREYRLTLPVEMPGRRMEGDEPVEHTPLPTGTALYGGDESVEHTPCAPGAHPGEPVEHIRVSPQGTQELDLDLDLELDHHIDGGVTKPQTQDQNQDQDQGQEPGLDDIPSGESPSEQRAWIESLRSGAERPSERLSNWLETLPGSARRDAERKVAVCYRQFESRPLLPNAAGPRSVIRYLSKGEAESMMNTSTHPALCDYLAAHIKIQFWERSNPVPVSSPPVPRHHEQTSHGARPGSGSDLRIDR